MIKTMAKPSFPSSYPDKKPGVIQAFRLVKQFDFFHKRLCLLI